MAAFFCIFYSTRLSSIFRIFLQYLSFIIFDPFIDLFITLCIVVNTLFMALDHHDMDPGMNDTLKNGNYVRHFRISAISAISGFFPRCPQISPGFLTAPKCIK
jgi:hypothetical protein